MAICDSFTGWYFDGMNSLVNLIGFPSKAGSQRKHGFEAIPFRLGHRGQREPQWNSLEWLFFLSNNIRSKQMGPISAMSHFKLPEMSVTYHMKRQTWKRKLDGRQRQKSKHLRINTWYSPWLAGINVFLERNNDSDRTVKYKYIDSWIQWIQFRWTTFQHL